MQKYAVAVALFLTHAMSFAQQGDLFKTLKAKFGEDPAVFVARSEVLTILLKNDSLEITADISEDVMHLKEQVDALAAGRVYGSHFNQVRDIQARTLVWEKSRFREMNVSDFKKNSDRSAGIFYDDSYFYSFNYPSIAVGNRTQLQYQSKVKDVRFIPGYTFSTYLPQAKMNYTIRTSPGVDLVYCVMNDPTNSVRFRTYEKGGFRYYEWSATDIAARRSEDNGPSYRYFAPHVISYVKSFQTPSGKVDVLPDVAALYKWYYGFIAGLDATADVTLNDVATSIRSGCKTEEEIVRAVYYWVQDNIQYVAFEDGMRGLIPHDGAYVCSKRYGDCKDMANLIVALLRASDIKAYHTWIGTRDLPYRYSEVPTPLVDNHMIATYINSKGEYIFLDGTSNHTPFGMPSSMIQGKEALIGISADKFEIRQVPVITMEKNSIVDSTFIRIDDARPNMIIGNGSIQLDGYPKIFGAYELDRTERDDARNYIARLSGKGSNKFYLDQYNVVNLTDRDKATKISYSFKIGDYFQRIGDELYVNLNLNKHFYHESINTSLRKTPRESDYKFQQSDYCDLEIPAGYAVEYLPTDVKVQNDLVGLEVTYRHQGEHIILAKRVYSNFLMLKPADFDRWNVAVKELSEAYKESIILKKK